jgi:hypothetical protein
MSARDEMEISESCNIRGRVYLKKSEIQIEEQK